MKDRMADSGITAESFAALARLAQRESGLQLATEKAAMVQSRLRHRLRALNITDFDDYSAFVCSQGGRRERRHMISALTTNVSHFFRESHHFDLLAHTMEHDLLPRLKSGKRVRIWSAGCANGQEAFSIAITLLRVAPEAPDLDIRILATDIDPQVVQFAKAACYPDRLVAGLPKALLERHFTQERHGPETVFCPHARLRNLITFKELNLLSNWPMTHQMDIVFCRNVVIYFDSETQNKLWLGFGSILRRGGYLFLGHSERIVDPEDAGFSAVGPTAYQRVAGDVQLSKVPKAGC